MCDALKYRLITRAFGCAQPLGDSIDVSMIGFFYSAVTPAAAGGQPFQVLHMHRRGIPTGTATSVICTVYSLWNIALVTLGIVGVCLCGGKLAAQSAAWIPVLALGLFVHAGLLSLVLLSAIFPKPMSAFGTACIRWLYRRKPFVRRGADPEEAAEKWCAFVAEYHDAFAAGIRHRGKLAGALALALGQCAAYMSVAYCTYRGFGLRGVPFWHCLPDSGHKIRRRIPSGCPGDQIHFPASEADSLLPLREHIHSSPYCLPAPGFPYSPLSIPPGIESGKNAFPDLPPSEHRHVCHPAGHSPESLSCRFHFRS